MLHILDQYQTEALRLVENYDLTYIYGQKSSGRSYLLRYIANQYRESGKNVLIVVPDYEAGEYIMKNLGAFDISRYSILLSEKSVTSAVTKMRSINKEEKIAISKNDLISSKHIVDTLHENISNNYELLNKKLINDKSLGELIALSSFDSRSYSNIHFNHLFDAYEFEYDQKEFAEINKNISQAFLHYQKQDNKTDVYFTKNAYSHKKADSDWNRIADWIEKSRIKVLKAIEYLSIFLNDQFNLKFTNEWKETKLLLNDFETLLVEIGNLKINFQDFKPKSAGFLGLDKYQKDQNDRYTIALQKLQTIFSKKIEVLKSNQYLTEFHLISDSENETIESLFNKVSKIVKIKDSLVDVIKNDVKKEIRSINLRNVRNEQTEKLQTELEMMFTELNNGYTIKKWEDTAFSINKQLNSLENILEDLNQIENYKTEFYKNYGWNSLLHNIDEKSHYLIKKLNIYRPKDWQQFIRNWYVQNLIMKYKIQFDIEISDQLAKFYSLSKEHEELLKVKTNKIWQNMREIQVAKSEDSNKSKIKNLFNQNDYSTTIDELLERDFELLSSFLPVWIVKSDDYLKYNKYFQNVDIILFSNCEEYKTLCLNNLNNLINRHVCFFSEDTNFYSELDNSVKKINSGKRIISKELQGFHQQGIIELTDMNYTERLYAARNIAFLMQSNNPDIKIYQMKNLVIFSSIEDILNKVMVKLLESKGIKEMKIIDTPFHLLVDNILESNNKQILLIENNLLNYKKFDNLLWQLQSIEKIRKSGIKVFNLDTVNLLSNPVKTFRDFVSLFA